MPIKRSNLAAAFELHNKLVEAEEEQKRFQRAITNQCQLEVTNTTSSPLRCDTFQFTPEESKRLAIEVTSIIRERKVRIRKDLAELGVDIPAGW